MNKRKILTMALAVAMVAILAVGGSLAFLTDTDSQVNTFTAGKVDIELDEVVVIGQDGKNIYDDGDNIIGNAEGTRTSETQNYKLHPNMTVEKDPTIWVAEDSEKAYIGAIITVNCEDLHDLIGVDGYANIDIHGLVSGGLVDDKEGTNGSTASGLHKFTANSGVYTIYQQVVKENETWKLYVVLEEIYEAGDSILLFDTLTIPADYDNDEMAILDGMEIAIDAYAVQIDGFDNATEALTTAFGTTTDEDDNTIILWNAIK